MRVTPFLLGRALALRSECDPNLVVIQFFADDRCTANQTVFTDDVGLCLHEDYVPLDQCTIIANDPIIKSINMYRLNPSEEVICTIYARVTA